MFVITYTAQLQLAKQVTDGCVIRIGVKGGGCSGFEYVIDTQAKKPKAKDKKIKFNQLFVYVDANSILYLNNVTLDYKKSLMYTGFEFINPNAKSKCGCGKSFNM
jgi:iron-sulfur cluster assembly protein